MSFLLKAVWAGCREATKENVTLQGLRRHRRELLLEARDTWSRAAGTWEALPACSSPADGEEAGEEVPGFTLLSPHLPPIQLLTGQT